MQGACAVTERQLRDRACMHDLVAFIAQVGALAGAHRLADGGGSGGGASGAGANGALHPPLLLLRALPTPQLPHQLQATKIGDAH